MNAPRDKQRLPTPDGESCSICLEMVESADKRSVARLKCNHVFHLDCIGSAFNAKGAMQCPNCRQVEEGQWLYSKGSLMQQEHFQRNDYARLSVEAVYLDNENERHEEGFDEMPRWSSRLYGPNAILQGEEDPTLNIYRYSRTDERQHQIYQSSGTYMPSMPGLDLRHTAPAVEITRRSVHPLEEERPLHEDLRASRGSAAYVQSLHPMLYRSYDQSNVNALGEGYPSHMLERSGYRLQMDDDGNEEHSVYSWPAVAGRTRRVPSDMGGAYNTPHRHMLGDFGLQSLRSSSEQSDINRFEAARYGHFARRAAGSHPSYVSSGLQDLAGRSLGNVYGVHTHGTLWRGRRIPQP